jgi:hypothetical protein
MPKDRATKLNSENAVFKEMVDAAIGCSTTAAGIAPAIARKTAAGRISGVDRLGRRWKIIHSGRKIFTCGGAGVKSFNAPDEVDIASARFVGS